MKGGLSTPSPLADEVRVAPAQVTRVRDATDTEHVLHQLSLQIRVIGKCH